MAAKCGVCLLGLGESPIEDEPVGAHVATSCGHLYHNSCWDKWGAIKFQIEDGQRRISCSVCREWMHVIDDVHRIYPTFDNAQDMAQEIGDLRAELEKMKLELEKSKNGVGQYGSRILKNKIYTDSSCFNCESKDHLSRNCPLQSFIRNKDITGSDAYEPLSKYAMMCKMPGRPAGTVISFFEDSLKTTLSRAAVQVAFGFFFFDNACWRCGNPFHHRADCPNDEIDGLHDIAKKMHEVNHPPSPSTKLKRFERKERFAGHGRP